MTRRAGGNSRQDRQNWQNGQEHEVGAGAGAQGRKMRQTVPSNFQLESFVLIVLVCAWGNLLQVAPKRILQLLH